MADVFISYASKNRMRAAEIAALLASKGFSVWWDQNLVGGDQFRRSIPKELYSSRIVIVIWTKDSVLSEWVLSEANRAHQVGSLLPLRDPELPRRDVPPPFDNLHMEPADDDQRIVQAVESMIARRPGFIRQHSLGGYVRYQVLSWLGIMGGAFTIFSFAGSLISLAKWARIIVEHWIDWTYQIWARAYELTGIRLSTVSQVETTFMLFLMAAAISTDLQQRLLSGERAPIFKFTEFKYWSIFVVTAFYFVHYHVHFWMIEHVLPNHVEYVFEDGKIYAYLVPDFEKFLYISNFTLIFFITRILTIGWPRRYAASSSFSIAIIGTFFFTAAAERFDYKESDLLLLDFLPILLIGTICRLVSVPVYFHKRLWIILGVLILLTICNQIALMDAFNS